jgi:hypothetical protein
MARLSWPILLIVACANPPAPPAQMAAAGNPEIEAVARRHIEEAWNAGNMAVFDETVTPAHVGYTNGVRDTMITPEQMKQSVTAFRTEYSDVHLQIDEMFSTADRVVMRWTLHGNHNAFKKPLTLVGSWIGRFEGGKLAEDWTFFDNAAAVTQLGGQVVPPAPPK